MKMKKSKKQEILNFCDLQALACRPARIPPPFRVAGGGGVSHTFTVEKHA